MKKSILMIGLHADAVDFEKWPQLNKESLEQAFEKVLKEMNDAGFDATWCLTDRGETAAQQVNNALDEKQPDIVLIGAGVRTDPDHFLLFEQLINIVHSKAPNARIAFNTIPHDSLQAVERWAD